MHSDRVLFEFSNRTSSLYKVGDMLNTITSLMLLILISKKSIQKFSQHNPQMLEKKDPRDYGNSIQNISQSPALVLDKQRHVSNVPQKRRGSRGQYLVCSVGAQREG